MGKTWRKHLKDKFKRRERKSRKKTSRPLDDIEDVLQNPIENENHSSEEIELSKVAGENGEEINVELECGLEDGEVAHDLKKPEESDIDTEKHTAELARKAERELSSTVKAKATGDVAPEKSCSRQEIPDDCPKCGAKTTILLETTTIRNGIKVPTALVAPCYKCGGYYGGIYPPLD